MKRNVVNIVLVLLLLCMLLSFDLPRGWIKAGSAPDKYAMETDEKEMHEGRKAATIRSLETGIKGFGTLMQQIDAGAYRGKRLRMTGWMKTAGVTGRAGFWLRVDQLGTTAAAAFDNMNDRPVKGTTNWTKYEIVLDVAVSASVIAFGVMLSADGQVWTDNLTFEVVDAAVPVTGTSAAKPYILSTKPVNLNFEQ